MDTRLWVVGLRHSDSPLILKKTSCSWSFRVNSSSNACRGQHIQTESTSLKIIWKILLRQPAQVDPEHGVTRKKMEEIKSQTWIMSIPSSLVLASLSTPWSLGCVPHPAPSAFGSHVQSEGGISHSERKCVLTRCCHD